MKKMMGLLLAVLLFVCLGAGCATPGVSKEEYQKSLDKIEELEAEADELNDEVIALRKQLKEARGQGERTTSAPDTDGGNPAEPGGRGTLYLQNIEGYDEEVCPKFTLYDNSTFSFTVNLLEGMGTITGDYYWEGDTLVMRVKTRDFWGFAGDDIDTFRFREEGEALVYENEQFIGVTHPEDHFVFWGNV